MVEEYDAQLKHEGKLVNAKVSLLGGVVFLFSKSLPKYLIPDVNDEVFVNSFNYHFKIKRIVPISEMTGGIYALEVEFID